LFGTGESNQAQYDLELPVFQGKLEIQTHTWCLPVSQCCHLIEPNLVWETLVDDSITTKWTVQINGEKMDCLVDGVGETGLPYGEK
jgi:hypothetical protein